MKVKKSSTLNQGLEEIEHFESIENEFIKPNYPNYSINRWITTYGKNIYNEGLNKKVLMHLDNDGIFMFNENAPLWIKSLNPN